MVNNIFRQHYKYGVVHEVNGINGGSYDAIEYAHVLSTIGKTKLILYCNNVRDKSIKEVKNMFIDTIHKKYNITEILFDIETQKNIIIDRNVFDSILYIDSGILSKLFYFQSKKHLILADYIPNNLHLYKKVCNLPNVYTFNEMPFFPSPVNYKFKFAFDIYKQYDKLEDNTLISYKGFQKGIFHTTKFINNKTKEEVKFNWPINDFNQKFNRYEVYSLPDWFDPRPRIYVESIYYGISIDNIIRNIDNENYDGAYYRLKDIRENGIEHRKLDINDEVIQIMVS